MFKDTTINPYYEQILHLIKEDFGVQYNDISSDLKHIYNSLCENSFDDDFEKYTNCYVSLYNDYVLFNEYMLDETNYKNAFNISKLFKSIKSNLYLYINNKYGLKKEIS